MTVDMEKYEKLLQQFGGISQNHVTEEALEKLKEEYKNHINSKRCLNDVVDINCLLKVLKKRGVLKYNDITVLRHISDEYVRNESIKQQIRDLITDYDQWLDENSGSINFLYNSGKSNIFLNSHELNVPKPLLPASESAYSHNSIDENLQTSTEDMAKKSLLTNESLNNLNIPQNKNDIDRNSFFVIKFKKFPLNINEKKSTTALVILILMFILIGIIWTLIKLHGESVAVAPRHPSTQAASAESHLNMPFYMASTSTSYSTQSIFSVHHTQTQATSTEPPIDKEKELQKIVVKELSKKIGIYWKDVCRSLDIDENTIDEITIEYSKEPPGQKNEKMFKKGLKLYFSEPRPRWKIELPRALKASRRVDLQERLEEIILDHSNL